MEVTKLNFKENLTVIESAINEASFLSIDTELTGLHNGETSNWFDTPEERYKKLREGSLDFSVIQFGLCAFQYNKENDCYTYKPFNFYVFPRQYLRSGPGPRFLCQSSSLEFLLEQGFDFNKVIKNGISYLSPSEAQKLREQMDEKHRHLDTQKLNNSHREDSSSVQNLTVVPDNLKDSLDATCKKIEEFWKSSEETLNLEPSHAFFRKLVFQAARAKYPSGIHLETNINDKKERFIQINKVDANKLRELEENKKKAEIEELETAFGFTKVIKMISSSQKLVVGHNMLLDVLHVLHKFCSPLPEEYEDFKTMVKCTFPRLLDTKLMGSTSPLKDKIACTVLTDLCHSLDQEPFQKPRLVVAEGFKEYNNCVEKYHEAGYDAYVTGVCFISMSTYLNSVSETKSLVIIPNSPLLEPFINKLHLMRLNDIPYLDLNGPDIVPCRDHVFHVTFPKEWKASDLCQLFSPFGGVFIAWINDMSAFVALSRREQADVAFRTLTQSDRYTVLRYADFKRKELARHKLRSGRDRSNFSITDGNVNLTDNWKSSSGEGDNSERGSGDERKRKRKLNMNDKKVSGRLSVEPIPEESEEDLQDSSEEVDAEDEALEAGCSSKKAKTCDWRKAFEESNEW